MHALVSVLPQQSYQQVEEIWRELEAEFGLKGVRITPIPHFTWQGARDYDFERLAEAITPIAREQPPLLVRTAGLGVFTGPQPVVFIHIVKTMELYELHARLWEAAQPHSRAPSPYYRPQAWIPHISLALEDVNQTNIAGVITRLAFRPYVWEMVIDHLAVLIQPSGQTAQVHHRFDFSGSPKETKH